ncbi:fimbrial protein [Escherichia albertii]|nr:fimbrial protein [Escherichia albertii]
MKKTLIALAVVASAVSGMAHAWTSGDFNDSVDIGGSITAEDYRQKWSWAVGSDINEFSNVLTDMTENGTKLTITVNGDKTILLGKTNEAFSAPVNGGVGAIPLIAFTDYEGGEVGFYGVEGGKGEGYMTLPMKNADGTKVGSVKINASYAGVALGSKESYSNLFSIHGGNPGSNIFSGGIAVGTSGAELQSGVSAAARTELFGSLSKADMINQLQAVDPDAVVEVRDYGQSSYTTMSASTNRATSAAYALGIANGQTIEVTFDKAVTASTQWSAPLNIAISYN